MILLDSSYLIGLILKKDTYTPKSNKLKPLIKHEKKLINNVILTEVLNSLTSINSNYDLNNIMDLFKSYEFDFITFDDYMKALSKFKYYNYAVNFSDCIILTTMEKYHVNKIASFDDDFDKVGGIHRIYLE